MPHDEPVFPPGPGVMNCDGVRRLPFTSVHHDAAAIFRSTWLSEVNKMKDVYGAHISDEQALKITDYLFSINGKAGRGQGRGTYGE